MKKYIVVIGLMVLALSSTGAYAGGLEDWMIGYDPSNPVKTISSENKIKVSSYQKLKQKYESECNYSNELKDRIVALQVKFHDQKLICDKAKNKPPEIIEREVIIEKGSSIESVLFFGFIGFLIGSVM